MAQINPELIRHVETNVFPLYSKNDEGHRLDHIGYVIRRSLLFMDQFEGMNADMVYAAAAYHDLAHHIDKNRHELLSAEMFYADEGAKRFFTDEQRQVIREAIEDHRASSDSVPRSDYGKVISSADRSTDIDEFFRRTHAYTLKHFPGCTWEQTLDRCCRHMQDKYGAGGYAKSYVEDREYALFLDTIRSLLADREAFEEKYRSVVGGERR